MEPKIIPLKKRSQFLAVSAQRKRFVTPAFILQIAPRAKAADPDEGWGVGLTASKKMVGIAVDRNRARRRLRALAKDVLPFCALSGNDFVFIARENILTRDYKELRADLEKALKRLEVCRKESKKDT